MVLMNVQADALKIATTAKRQSPGPRGLRPYPKALVWLQAVIGRHGGFGKCGVTTDLRAGKITVTSRAGSPSVGQPARSDVQVKDLEHRPNNPVSQMASRAMKKQDTSTQDGNTLGSFFWGRYTDK